MLVELSKCGTLLGHAKKVRSGLYFNSYYLNPFCILQKDCALTSCLGFSAGEPQVLMLVSVLTPGTRYWSTWVLIQLCFHYILWHYHFILPFFFFFFSLNKLLSKCTQNKCLRKTVPRPYRGFLRVGLWWLLVRLCFFKNLSIYRKKENWTWKEQKQNKTLSLPDEENVHHKCSEGWWE